MVLCSSLYLALLGQPVKLDSCADMKTTALANMGKADVHGCPL